MGAPAVLVPTEGSTVTSTEEFDAWATSRYGSLLHAAFLLTGSRDTAQDLVQTSLAKTHLAWRRVHTSPDAYVRRVMLTTHTDWWRRQPWRERSTATLLDRADTGDGHGQVDDRDALFRALQDLPARMRSIVVLRYYLQLTESECADLLGCSIGTIKSTSSRALDRLRSHPMLTAKEPC
jgi:RNA polymerase sigma-70 factor (sigma-E family)